MLLIPVIARAMLVPVDRVIMVLVVLHMMAQVVPLIVGLAVLATRVLEEKNMVVPAARLIPVLEDLVTMVQEVLRMMVPVVPLTVDLVGDVMLVPVVLVIQDLEATEKIARLFVNEFVA
jgi:hypothetical protein